MPDQTQVVLRYRGGQTERVTLTSIDADRERVEVRRDGAAGEVAFAELKAIFFPRDQSTAASEAGEAVSTIAVEFADGELIRGVAHYNPIKNSFFLFPLDRSKNDKIFVVNSAIVSIEVERLER